MKEVVCPTRDGILGCIAGHLTSCLVHERWCQAFAQADLGLGIQPNDLDRDPLALVSPLLDL